MLMNYQPLITKLKEDLKELNKSIEEKEPVIPHSDLDMQKQLETVIHALKRVSADGKIKSLNTPNGMPLELTAENGAKNLFRGEFYELFYTEDCDKPYIIPIQWSTIKRIYAKIVHFYTE